MLPQPYEALECGDLRSAVGCRCSAFPLFSPFLKTKMLDTPKPPLFKFSVPTCYGDISFFDAHLLGEEKNEFAVR
jgi:hypothetical protein